MKKIIIMLVLALSFGLAGSVFAAEAPFTQGELNLFLETFPGFRDKAEEIGESMEGVEDPDAAQLMSANQELTSYLKDGGWDDPKRFFYVMGHCGTGIAILKSGGTDGSMNSLLAQQRAAIEQAPMPEAQKQAALKALEESMADMQSGSDELSMDVPPEEMELIRQNQARIEKVLMSE